MSKLQPPASDSLEPVSGDAGQRAEFDAALAGYRGELLGYLRKRLGDPDAAADFTQETFSRMMVYRDAPDIADRRMLMYRIANNLILEARRARYRRHSDCHVSLDDAGPLARDESSVEAIADARRIIDTLVKRAIVRLPDKCRVAFVLYRFHELTAPEVANRMGISVKMVEKHIARARLACLAAVGDRDA